MIRVRIRVGDVFSAIVSDDGKKYLQYVANDLSQLNSDVIRVFKEVYPIDSDPELSEVVSGEVEFYAHCMIKLGVKFGFWEKVGSISNTGNTEVLFKSSGDDGNPTIKVSANWWVWKINQEQTYVGKLKGENRKAEIGSVIPPDSIMHRMKTGKYDFVYPEYN